MYCTECGKKNLESSNLCEYCGRRMQYKEPAGDGLAGEPLPGALGWSGGNGAVSRLLVFSLVLMFVFPVIVLKRSVGLYRESGSTAPESDLLSTVAEIAASRGNRDVAARWSRFDRSLSGWSKSTVALDVAIVVCSAWIGYNLFTRKPFAAVRARQFMIAVALWAITRDVVLPKIFDLSLTGNKLSMITSVAAALACYMYLQRLEASTPHLSTRATGS